MKEHLHVVFASNRQPCHMKFSASEFHLSRTAAILLDEVEICGKQYDIYILYDDDIYLKRKCAQLFSVGLSQSRPNNSNSLCKQ